MTIFKSFDIAATGMSAQRTRMNVAASNLANQNTTRTPEGGPYRRRDVVLEATPLGNDGREIGKGLGDGEPMGVRVAQVVESQDPPRLIHDPGHPDADENGYVQLPNISSIKEMVNMMGAARAYEAGTSVMQTVKQMAEQALRIGR